MGYVIEAMGTISYAPEDEEFIVHAVKDLNHQHHLKRGGRSPKTGDPYDDLWFSWVPPRYHEDEKINSVLAILEMIGFECDGAGFGEPGRVTYSISLDAKQGQEVYFLQAMAPWCEIYVEVRGEEFGDFRLWKSDSSQTGLHIGGAIMDYDMGEWAPVDAYN